MSRQEKGSAPRWLKWPLAAITIVLIRLLLALFTSASAESEVFLPITQSSAQFVSTAGGKMDETVFRQKFAELRSSGDGREEVYDEQENYEGKSFSYSLAAPGTWTVGLNGVDCHADGRLQGIFLYVDGRKIDVSTPNERCAWIGVVGIKGKTLQISSEKGGSYWDEESIVLHLVSGKVSNPPAPPTPTEPPVTFCERVSAEPRREGVVVYWSGDSGNMRWRLWKNNAVIHSGNGKFAINELFFWGVWYVVEFEVAPGGWQRADDCAFRSMQEETPPPQPTESPTPEPTERPTPVPTEWPTPLPTPPAIPSECIRLSYDPPVPDKIPADGFITQVKIHSQNPQYYQLLWLDQDRVEGFDRFTLRVMPGVMYTVDVGGTKLCYLNARPTGLDPIDQPDPVGTPPVTRYRLLSAFISK